MAWLMVLARPLPTALRSVTRRLLAPMAVSSVLSTSQNGTAMNAVLIINMTALELDMLAGRELLVVGNLQAVTALLDTYGVAVFV